VLLLGLHARTLLLWRSRALLPERLLAGALLCLGAWTLLARALLRLGARTLLAERLLPGTLLHIAVLHPLVLRR
jgi:hypothetical protein